MSIPHQHTNTTIAPSTTPKQLSSKAKLFSIIIVFIAITGISLPFIHMVFPKYPQEVINLRIAHYKGEMTDEEYKACRLEQRKTYSWHGYQSSYYFYYEIGRPLPILCATILLLYCLRFIGEQRAHRIIYYSGIFIFFAAMYSFLYLFTEKIYEDLFVFNHLDIKRYAHPLYYHGILLILSLLITATLIQTLTKKTYLLQKIKIIIRFIVHTRIRITMGNTVANQKFQEKFDQEFYATLEHIHDPVTSTLCTRYKNIILGFIIVCSGLGGIVLLAYPLHPNTYIHEHIPIRKEFWDGTISKKTLLQKREMLYKKYPYEKNIQSYSYIQHISYPLGITLSVLIIFAILPFINEKYAKRGMIITAITFSLIALFYLRWAFFKFEGETQDYHINYYYTMMSVSSILIILVIYQFIQSAVTYKYKMMELIHFIIGTRKHVFNALETQNNTTTAIQQQKEQFDEEFYDTLDKVTKK